MRTYETKLTMRTRLLREADSPGPSGWTVEDSIPSPSEEYGLPGTEESGTRKQYFSPSEKYGLPGF